MLKNKLASALVFLTSAGVDNWWSGLYCCPGEGSVDCRSVSSASYKHNQTRKSQLTTQAITKI